MSFSAMAKHSSNHVSKSPFLPNDKDRLILILALTILYPVIAGSLFVLFLFWLHPILRTALGAVLPGTATVLYGYWLVCALLWFVLMSIFLPLMSEVRGDDKRVTYRRESGISIKDGGTSSESNSLKDDDKTKKRTYGIAETSLNGSLDKKSTFRSSQNSLVPPSTDHDIIRVSNPKLSVSQYDLENHSVADEDERKQLTKSGEFLNDCLDSVQSEDDINGEIIKENVNCEVHVQDDSRSDTSRTSRRRDPEELQRTADGEPCVEPLLQKTEREPSQLHNQYADVEKVKLLTDGDNQQTKSDQVQENVGEVNKDVENGTELAEEVAPFIREKPRKALPTIDTSRASMADSYAPSTLSPRESNMVFLFVNADEQS